MADDVVERVAKLISDGWRDTDEVTARKIVRALSQAGAGGGVVVKPLEWSEPDAGGKRTAATASGWATVWLRAKNEWRWELGGVAAGWERTYQDAVKVLWLTYEARILAALAPSPSAGERDQPTASVEAVVPPVTDEMLQAARYTLPGGFTDICDADLEDIWEAMHRASLTPAPTQGDGVRCTYCGDTGTITDRVDGDITCPECGYARTRPHGANDG